MSDVMESKGGKIDVLKLARELDAPVAQISAFRGTGIDAVPLFLNQQNGHAKTKRVELPVIGNAASTHNWAAQISSPICRPQSPKWASPTASSPRKR